MSAEALAAPRARRLTTALLVVLIAAGVLLRLHDPAAAPTLTADEEPLARNAHRLLVGFPARDDQPELGKLLLGVGLVLFGDGPLGVRFVALCFGLHALLLAFWLGRALFSPRAGLFAAAFLAADGFFLTHARAGLLDGIVASLVLWSLLAAALARSWRGALVSALLVGVAASVDWTALVADLPAILILRRRKEVPRWSQALFLLVPVVPMLAGMAALALAGKAATPAAALAVMARQARRLQASGSPAWAGWLVMARPAVLKASRHGLDVRLAFSAANPVLFFPALGAVVAVAIRAVRRRREAGDFTLTALPLAVAWASLLAGAVTGHGKGASWSPYLPAYGCALVLLAGWTARLEARRPRAAAALVAAALATAAWMAPVWGELPLREREAARRVWVKGW